MDYKYTYRYLLIAFFALLGTQLFPQPCALDVFVANDQSGSVSATENAQSRLFISALMAGMQPWGNNTGESRMAIAEWASPGTWSQFPFTSVAQNYTTLLSDVLGYQIAGRQLTGGTGPYGALLHTYNALQQTPVPGRFSNKIIVLMTDAACPQVPVGMIDLATQIKNEGVFIIVVAIGAASVCPTLSGTNIASPSGYFSAADYTSLISANVQLVEDIISTACIGPVSATFDLSIFMNSYTVSNCTSVQGSGTYSIDFTINNGLGAGQDFNDEILISFYDGDPKLASSNLVLVQSMGTQLIPIGGSYNGTVSSPSFANTGALYAVVNFNGGLPGNGVPLSPYLETGAHIADEVVTVNNFSALQTLVGDPSCPPYGVVSAQLVSGGVGCDDLVSYEITVCNSGNADVFLTSSLPITVPGAVLLTDTTPVVDLTAALDWASYYGDSDIDHGYNVDTDLSGNVFMTGFTKSQSGISTVGAHQTVQAGNNDAFLVKFDPDGNRLWGTYFGGDENDKAYGVATDSQGNVYIVGNTDSETSIATAGAYQTTHVNSDDGFIAKFNWLGVLQWASYYGGSSVDFALSVATDASDNVFMSGFTQGSANLASASAHQTSYNGNSDLFLVKFNGNGVRQWATYYGGLSEELDSDIVTDISGNVYLVGSTQSTSSIVTSGAHQTINNGDDDVFLVKFNAAGSRQWGTYYGGLSSEVDPCVTTDLTGNVFLGGKTRSLGSIALPSTHQSIYGGGLGDGFLVKFNSTGIRQWGTYFGGGALDEIDALTTDPMGNIFITGSTTSATDIATAHTYQTNVQGQDAFISKFTNDGAQLWGTYFGGAGNEMTHGVATDTQGDAFICGLTSSLDNIATSWGHQTVYGTLEDAFLAKFGERDVGSVLYQDECVTSQYLFDYSAVGPGTYDLSLGLVADSLSSLDATALILPDNGFSAGIYVDVDGFNGALHSSDDVTLVAVAPLCNSGDQISISVDIPTVSSCSTGNFSQATISINNTSGVNVYNTYLNLTLSGAAASFAGELYNIPSSLLISIPSVLDPAYPAVPFALFNQVGPHLIPIQQIPLGISTFNVDINAGSTLTNLSAQVDSIHSAFNASGQSNLATDAGGLIISPYPTISGFNCPSSIVVGSSIVLNGISTISASTIAWSSTSQPILTNGGTVSSPSIIYSPNPSDEANGFVELSIIANSAAGCQTNMSCQVAITNVQYDYGDAPLSYDQNANTQPLAAAATLHSGVYLGLIAPSVEATANNSAQADGDGLEEDAIANPYSAVWPVPGQVFNLDVQNTNNSSQTAYMTAFLDWNADGDYLDSLEKALTTFVIPAMVGTQTQTMQFIVPVSLNTAATQFYIRMRISTDSIAVSVPYQGAAYGETEDNVWPPSEPLPIDLLYFRAKVHAESSVRLTWRTASEVYNDYFLLERSDTGLGFETLAYVAGSGNSSTTLNYSYVDDSPLKGTSYYRLKQVDYNGKFEYFGPEIVQLMSSNDLHLMYLNEETIEIIGFNSQERSVSIIDMKGSQKEINLSESGLMDISGFASGIYVLRIARGEKETIYLNFIVR